MELKEMSSQQLKAGIIRCTARLLGLIPFGLMKNKSITRKAMREYQSELDKRKQTELDLK